MKNKEIITLSKMIEYIEKVLRYTKECTYDEFLMDEEKTDATIFAISQIGEVVKNISEETMKKYNNIEWIVIKNLRNKIVHDYDGINFSLIWDIISNDITQLKEDLQSILKDNKLK